jgi:hypothetical protein
LKSKLDNQPADEAGPDHQLLIVTCGFACITYLVAYSIAAALRGAAQKWVFYAVPKDRGLAVTMQPVFGSRSLREEGARSAVIFGDGSRAVCGC